MIVQVGRTGNNPPADLLSGCHVLVSRRFSGLLFGRDHTGQELQESVIRNSILPKDVFRQDAAERADVAIVFGASDPDYLRHRIGAGIALYAAKRVSALLLSGDGRRKSADGRSEADRMRDHAVKAGVPADAIVLEEASQDSVSTAKECAQLLKSNGRLQSARSAILVSSAWHMLRLFLVMRRHLPKQLAISCFPATEGITAANWQTTPQGRAIVENELRLIEKLLKSGYSLK